MPILYFIYKKFGGIVSVILVFILCGFYADKNSDMTRWLFTLVLGMIFAENNFLAKIKEYRIIKKYAFLDYLFKRIFGGALCILCVYVRQNIDWTVSYLRDGIIPVIIIVYCYMVITDIPIVKDVLRYIGKHSMNIFLAHTFLRAYYLKDFIYSFKYPVVIIIVLTVLSLCLSIIIEWLKKYSGYNKMISKMLHKAVKADAN